MDERTLQWRVGIVVICAALILAILIFLFGEGWQSQYTVFVNTRTAPNVTKNTPVRKNGILIGRVASVENQDQGVLLTLKINRDEPIFENEILNIGTASFLGDAVLDFAPGNQAGRGEQITDRMFFENVVVERNPIELIDMALNLEQQVSDTLTTVDKAGQGIADLTNTIQDALGEDEGNIKQFVIDARTLAKKAETAMENFNAFMVNLNEVVGDAETRDSMRVALGRLPQMIDEINLTVTDARETIEGFQKVSESADRNLANLEQFTNALGENGPLFVENLNKTLQRIDGLVNDVSMLTQAFTQSDGTLGKLINDPALYNNLNDTIRNAREISILLRPLINDLRYAADGIARDPGQLGLRGAFDRGPAFGKYKGTLTGSDR